MKHIQCSQHSSLTDDKRRRRHSNEFKATQQKEKGMQQILSSSLYKDMLQGKEKEKVEPLFASAKILSIFLYVLKAL